MRISDSKVFAEFAKTPKEGAYDFYRCGKCNRIFSREHETSTFKYLGKLDLGPNEDKQIRICNCGSRKYSPSWPTGLEWIRPGVARYVVKLVLAREVAPWLDKHFPWPLPLVEFLVKPKEA